MNERTFHLLVGVLLFSLYIILSSIGMPLMRLTKALSPPQALVLIAVSEAVTLLPFVNIIWKEWRIKKPIEWIAFTFTCTLLATNFLVLIVCSQHMSLGETWRLCCYCCVCCCCCFCCCCCCCCHCCCLFYMNLGIIL